MRKTLRSCTSLTSVAMLLVLWLSACGGSVPHPGAKSTATPIIPGTVTTWPQQTLDAMSAYADRYVATMSLDDKIGQMIMVQFYHEGYNGDSVTMIKQFHVGGVILYHWIMPTKEAIIDETSGPIRDSVIPPLLSVDVEGGGIDSLDQIFGTRPNAYQMAATGNPQYAYDQGVKTADDLQSLGFNTDLAPVVDVRRSDSFSPGRSFSSDPAMVTQFAGAYMRGLQDSGMVASLKHFPGLGAATIDAHLGLPVITFSRQQLDTIDLVPYRDLIQSAQPPDMIMPTDVLMTGIDPTLPAEISPKAIDGVLRHDLGYDGVVITDGLYMDGIWPKYGTVPQLGVKAIEAGCDMLLGTFYATKAESAEFSVEATVNAIKAAINSGDLTEARINQSVKRILLLKMKRGLMPYPNGSSPDGSAPGYSSVVDHPTGN